MPYKKNNPGCNASGACGCGTDDCAICTSAGSASVAFEQDFQSLEDGPITGSGFTVASGDWEIASHKLVLTSSDGFVTAGTHPNSFELRGKCTGDGSSVYSILFGGSGPVDYYELIIQFGVGISLYETVSGSSSSLMDDFGGLPDGEHEFIIRRSGSEIGCRIPSLGLELTGEATFSGTEWGVAVYVNDSDPVAFDDFVVTEPSPCLPFDVLGKITYGTYSDGSSTYPTAIIDENSVLGLLPRKADTPSIAVLVGCLVKVADSSDVFDLIFKYKDDDNQWYIRVTASTGKIQIFKVLGGSTTEVTSSTLPHYFGAIPVDQYYALAVCYGEGHIMVKHHWDTTTTITGGIGGSISFAVDTTTATDDQPYAGVRSVSVASEIEFTRFRLEYGYEEEDEDRADCDQCPTYVRCNEVPCVTHYDAMGDPIAPPVSVTIGEVFASSIAEATTPSYFTDRRKALRCDFTSLNNQSFTLPHRGSQSPIKETLIRLNATYAPFRPFQGTPFFWYERFDIDFCYHHENYTSGLPECGDPLAGQMFLIVAVNVICESSGGITRFQGNGYPQWGNIDTSAPYWPDETNVLPKLQNTSLPLLVSGYETCRVAVTLAVCVEGLGLAVAGVPQPTSIGMVEWGFRSADPINNLTWGYTAPFSRLGCGGGALLSPRNWNVYGGSLWHSTAGVAGTTSSAFHIIGSPTGGSALESDIKNYNLDESRYAVERCKEGSGATYNEYYVEPFLLKDDPGSALLEAP